MCASIFSYTIPPPGGEVMSRPPGGDVPGVGKPGGGMVYEKIEAHNTLLSYFEDFLNLNNFWTVRPIEMIFFFK